MKEDGPLVIKKKTTQENIAKDRKVIPDPIAAESSNVRNKIINNASTN